MSLLVVWIGEGVLGGAGRVGDAPAARRERTVVIVAHAGGLGSRDFGDGLDSRDVDG